LKFFFGKSRIIPGKKEKSRKHSRKEKKIQEEFQFQERIQAVVVPLFHN
jgi:hypothetical protein